MRTMMLQPEPTETTDPRTTSDKVSRLSNASLRRVIEPEEIFDWKSLGTGQIIPDELLSVAGLDVELDRQQRAQLSREETAAMLTTGVRFEAVLMAGFSMQLAEMGDLSDPRLSYMLHEMGEETRHSRAFARLVEALAPKAENPLDRGIAARITRKLSRSIMRSPALLTVFVLAGEEIPDLLQRMASEHPDTDPLLAAVNRYHRSEEARHLSFARTVLPELWAAASRRERFRIRHGAPYAVHALFNVFVHPGVYSVVGLPGFKTWRAANKAPQRVAVRHAGTRPIVRTLLDAGILEHGKVPKGWQKLSGVDHNGETLPGDAPLPV